MRSIPWSNTSPHFDDAPVQRASFPSTVSSTMKMKPESTPHQYSPRQKRKKASTHSTAPTSVTKFGREPSARGPAGQVEGGLAPQIQRQHVGHALVGRVIRRALDGLRVGGVERQHERPLALSQLVVAELRRLRVELLVAADRARRCRVPAQSSRRLRPAGTCAITGLPPSVSTVRGRPAIAFSHAGSHAYAMLASSAARRG